MAGDRTRLVRRAAEQCGRDVLGVVSMSDVLDITPRLDGTTTPRFQLNKPLPGGDLDVWGDETNANWDALDGLILPLSGGTLTGPLILAADPVVALGAASKQYVDAHGVTTFNGRAGAVTLAQGDITGALGYTPVNKAGDTMTGPLVLAADPAVALGSATKQYVDAHGVTTFNGRAGAVTLSLADVTGVGGAPLASPAFTGVPTAPNAVANTNTAQLATTQFANNILSMASINVAGGVDYTLTLAQCGVGMLYLYGALTANINVIFPAATTAIRTWQVMNVTTGAFTLTLKGASGGTVLLRQGGRMQVWTDTGGIYASNTDAISPGQSDNSTAIASTSWVTSKVAGYLPLAGGTMTGALALAANPTTNNQAATKQYVDTAAAGAAAGGATNVGRNVLHNSQFLIAQRGAGPFTTNSAGSLDRWATLVNLDTISVTQATIADTGRAQIGDEEAATLLSNSFTGNAGAGAYNYIAQRIENVRRLSNKTVTVSGWAQCGSGTLRLGISLDQYFGTGGSPSASVYGAGQAVTVTTTWTRFAATFSLPSLAGLTLGTNGDHYTALNLWFSSGTTNATRAGSIGVQSGAINLWGLQLEVAATASPFEKRELADDLRHCQRFYQTGQINYGCVATSVQTISQTVMLPVPMRTNPAVTPTWSYTNTTSGGVGTGPAWVQAYANSVAAGAASFAMSFTASAEL
jgi:hypothetical protein